jgi:hypothetical protein
MVASVTALKRRRGLLVFVASGFLFWLPEFIAALLRFGFSRHRAIG